MIFKKSTKSDDPVPENAGAEEAQKEQAAQAAGEPAGTGAEEAAAGDARDPSASGDAPSDAAADAAGDERAKKLEDDLARLKDAHLRLMADFENHRRRNVREREELVKRANESLVESLLPTLDAIDLAMKQKPASDDPFAKGIEMVFDLLRNALADAGLKPVEDAKGKTFDPRFHEAVASVPSATVPENEVIEQTRRGYLLNDWLLRAAQVVVSSGSPEAEAAGPDAGAPAPGASAGTDAGESGAPAAEAAGREAE